MDIQEIKVLLAENNISSELNEGDRFMYNKKGYTDHLTYVFAFKKPEIDFEDCEQKIQGYNFIFRPEPKTYIFNDIEYSYPLVSLTEEKFLSMLLNKIWKRK